MFSLTSDLLRSILSLQSSEQTRGAWIVFLRELAKIRDQHVLETIHYMPSSNDVNAEIRQNVLRGITICLDVIVNALNDPMSILEDIDKIGKKSQDNSASAF